MMKRDNYKENSEMGMSASQGRLGSLLNRKANIIGRQQNISMQKTILTRQMNELTRKARLETNQKAYKWTNNSGVTYVDMSYANLMRPNLINQRMPYMITDNEGKIVIDSKYLKYAEMISPDGSGSGDWNSVKMQILSEILGVNQDDLKAYVDLESAVNDCLYQYNQVSYLPDDAQEKIDAKNELDKAQDAWNDLSDWEGEENYDFYNKLFSSIADNGWVYNDKVADSDYLNQMFQNGSYKLTTVQQDVDEEGEYLNFYSTDIAANCSKVIMVNDSTANNKATGEYEYRKSIIQQKENALDTRQKDLETELSAIQEMIKGLIAVRDKNVENTMKIFTG